MIRIGFAGFGKMAQAIAQGLENRKSELDFQLFASGRDQAKLDANCKKLGVIPASNEEIFKMCDVVFVCVKPYQVQKLLNDVELAGPDQVLICVAAGISGEEMSAMAQQDGYLCLLPNLPVAINKGVMVLDSCSSLSDKQKQLTDSILNLLGTPVTVEKSAQDAAGVLSGCAPAWTAMFMEALADGAVLKGVPRDQARILAAAMVEGTAAMIAAEQMPPASFKDNVCSPGGTTIRGVKALEDHGFRSGVISAVEASCKK